jgi:hypothetical protein
MHKQRVAKTSNGVSPSSTQSQECQKLANNDPKQITTQQFQKIVVTFFMEHTMAYLDNAFASK